MNQCDNVKTGVFTVDLAEDQKLDVWDVKIHSKGFDKDSQLFKDLNKIKASTGKDYVQLYFHFDDMFPFHPPFVRIVDPVLFGGFVHSGGAMCMEQLTKEGWGSATSIEAVILQVASTLVKGRATVDFNSTGKVCIQYFN